TREGFAMIYQMVSHCRVPGNDTRFPPFLREEDGSNHSQHPLAVMQDLTLAAMDTLPDPGIREMSAIPGPTAQAECAGVRHSHEAGGSFPGSLAGADSGSA